MAKRNILRKLFSGALAAVIAASSAAVSASASSVTKDGMIDYLYDFKFITSGYTDDANFTSTWANSKLIKKLRNAYMNFETTIDVSSWNLTKTEMNGVTIIVRAVYPELFFLESNNWDLADSSDNPVVTKLYPQYIYKNPDGTADTVKIKEELKKFYAEADRYIAMAKGKLSTCRDDFSKILLIHDEIALDCRYAYEKLTDETVPFNEYNNYEMMVNKDGVCRHYSQVYAYVLGQLGIQTELVSTPDTDKTDSSGRNGLNHEWLKVKLDGSWYHIDLTWDDQHNNKKPLKGQVWHNNFLFSDAAFDQTGHYGYKQLNSSNNSKYDKAPFHQYVSKCCKLDPDSTLIYAIKWETKPTAKSNTTKKNWYLVSYDYVTGVEKKLKDLSDNSWAGSKTGNDVWTYPQTSLEAYGNLLFYNTSRQIRCFDTRTNTDYVVSTTKEEYTGLMFGLRMKNNVLYYYYGDADEQSGEFIRSKTTEYKSSYYTDYAIPPETITLDKTTAYIGVGGTVSLNAEVSPSDAADFLYWESSDPTVAEVKNGVVTAKKAGKATIRVRSLPNNKTAACRIVVNNGPTGVTIDQTEATVLKGSSLQLNATVSPDTSKSKKVVWKSTDPTIASVDQTGKVTAKKAGEVIISATTAINVITATCKVKVTVPVSKIMLSKTTLSLDKGSTAQLKATVLPDTAENKTVTWKSTNNLVVTVDQTGKVTAKGAGIAKIKAKTSNGKIAVCTVTVTIPVTSVALNKYTASVNKGGTLQLKATVYPDNATDKTITWKSMNTKIATVDQTGKVTALAKGTVVIKAKAKNGISASCTLTVKVPAKAVTLSKKSVSMYPGDTFTLGATLTPASSTDTITWSALNTNVATVDSTGTVTAKAVGSTKIYAKTTSGKYAYCVVKVIKKEVKVSRIFFDPAEFTTYKNCKLCVSDMLYYTPADATDNSFTYTSENNSMVTLKKENGKIYAYTNDLTGTVYITAKSVSGLTAKLKLNIMKQLNGTVEFDVAVGRMTVSTENGVLNVSLCGMNTTVYGGGSSSINYNGYKYLIEAFADGTAKVTETASDGDVVEYYVR